MTYNITYNPQYNSYERMVKRFKNLEIFASEKEGRDYIKAHRLRSYSLNQASNAWGGAWVLWYNRRR